jgi:3-phenylpropionate/trans-cinnamate dioxygenase ferredoxin reductase component
MQHYKYLIIGAGMTADAAIQAIREADPNGTIGLIGKEPHPPYDRPPLSKKLWKGKPLEIIWRETEKYGVEIHAGKEIMAIDPAGKSAEDNEGTTYTWEKLLLATGGTTRRLPFGGDDVIYFRTLDDYQRLRGLTGEGKKIAVIGAGFIGTEIAAALAMNGIETVMIFTGEDLCERIFPRDMAQYLSDYYRKKGVHLLNGQTVTGLERHGGSLTVTTSGNETITVDGVVAGLGILPNVELARAAGLEVGNGIVVDEFLRTGNPDIFAAGDVALFYNPALAKRMRVEHEDNANAMGLTAGRNMAGGRQPYHHLPFFYSDMFELGYEAVGEIDARLETFSDWQTPYRKGVVYYLSEGRVRGVLLRNVWEQVEAARRLIAAPGPFRPEDLRGRLPE